MFNQFTNSFLDNLHDLRGLDNLHNKKEFKEQQNNKCVNNIIIFV